MDQIGLGADAVKVSELSKWLKKLNVVRLLCFEYKKFNTVRKIMLKSYLKKTSSLASYL